jgi:superfamily II DNA/RNA helicase
VRAGDRDIEKAAALRPVRILSVYGGRAYEPQVEFLRKGAEVVVGTPGRLIDLAQQGHLDLGHVRTLVLDEADEMLDLGFLPDVEKIVRLVPAGRQTMLFSATMPERSSTWPAPTCTTRRTSARSIPTTTVTRSRRSSSTSSALTPWTRSRCWRGSCRRTNAAHVVFCRTKRTAQKVADDLAERGFAAGAVHGDLGQGARSRRCGPSATGKIDVLVATDVAARGIDVADITHVVNYQCPKTRRPTCTGSGVPPGRRQGNRHHVRRLGRPGALDADRQGSGPRLLASRRRLYSTSDHFHDELEIPHTSPAAAEGRAHP